VDWVPPRANHIEGLMLVFDGGQSLPGETSTIRLPAEEPRSWTGATSDRPASVYRLCWPGV